MILTLQELSALAQLLNRLPMTPAEGLWVQSLMNKLGTMIQSPESKAEDDNVP